MYAGVAMCEARLGGGGVEKPCTIVPVTPVSRVQERCSAVKYKHLMCIIAVGR